MKNLLGTLTIMIVVGLSLVGCAKKNTVSTKELEKAFEIQPAASPATARANPSQPQDPVRGYVEQAVSAIKTNDYVSGVVMLQTLRAEPSLNADQLAVVQDTMGKIQSQLAERAERGDPYAIRVMEQLRRRRP
ncbi:MAG: hypothetical protein AAB466_00450 [Verrucomicrobiota bacterium]